MEDEHEVGIVAQQPQAVPWPRLRCLASCLSVCALGACTSFAPLDDSPLFGENDMLPAEGGAPGMPVRPTPQAGSTGTITGTPAPLPGLGPPPVGSAGDAGSPAPAPPGVDPPVALADAGSTDVRPPPSSPDPGSAGPAPLDPASPDPVEVPECVGAALELDGATFASLPRVVDGDFTLEAWIKTVASLPGDSAFIGRAVFDADVIGMGQQNDFAVTVLDERLAFGVGNPDTTLQSLSAVATDQWVHVAVTRLASNGQLRIFINGALNASGVAPNRNLLAGRAELAIGGFTASRKFIGSIDEVKIWSLVRSVDAIASTLRERPNGSEEGLVGYYSFEDQGTTQTADGSALGLVAGLTGSPSYVSSTALCPPAQSF